MPDDSRTWDDFIFFKKSEFDCKCGCGRNEMDLDFVSYLDFLRGSLGFPLVVTSGYRCPDHNEAVSSTGRTGPHTSGRAVDVGIYGGRAHALVRAAAIGGRITGIGFKQHGVRLGRFIHLDEMETGPRPNVWTYPN